MEDAQMKGCFRQHIDKFILLFLYMTLLSFTAWMRGDDTPALVRIQSQADMVIGALIALTTNRAASRNDDKRPEKQIVPQEAD